ncbi:MAG: hypothetical protein M1826_004008 [Phylliscum demangeonii]|nr:MAG: hypothetical protein M1826_004008 [Phylliscum demangeonii]
MVLARAFTSRRAVPRPEISSPTAITTPCMPAIPHRSASVRIGPGAKPIMRSQISAPMQLLSTSNMLSYNAPDIAGATASRVPNGAAGAAAAFGRSTTSLSSAASSSSRDGDGDGSSDDDRAGRSPSSPATSLEPSPMTSPEVRNTAIFFHASADQPPSSTHAPVISLPLKLPIPHRAASHTKASHHALARHRSRHHHVAPPVAIPAAVAPAAVAPRHEQHQQQQQQPQHPFGAELQQVDEVAEELGLKPSMAEVVEAEALFLRQRGLLKFSVQDYLAEIQGLFGGVFEDHHLGTVMAPAWI